jgi:hypothetical protein
MPRITKTNNDFINEAKIVHGELYDYLNTNYVHALTKLIITCKTHGNFEQMPNKLTSKKISQFFLLRKNKKRVIPLLLFSYLFLFFIYFL